MEMKLTAIFFVVFAQLNSLKTSATSEENLISDVNWLVGIYSREGSQKEIYHCEGVAVHYRVVITSSLCITSDPVKTLYFIRAYIWPSEIHHTSDSNFENYKVSRVFYHRLSTDTWDGIAFLLIESSLRSYLNVPLHGHNPEDTIRKEDCIIIHLKHKANEVIAKRYAAKIGSSNSCPNKITEEINADTKNMYSCAQILGKKNCKDYKGGALFCKSLLVDNQFHFAGLQFYKDGCHSLHLKIKRKVNFLLNYYFVLDTYWRNGKLDDVPSPDEMIVKLI